MNSTLNVRTIHVKHEILIIFTLIFHEEISQPYYCCWSKLDLALAVSENFDMSLIYIFIALYYFELCLVFLLLYQKTLWSCFI